MDMFAPVLLDDPLLLQVRCLCLPWSFMPFQQQLLCAALVTADKYTMGHRKYNLFYVGNNFPKC